jgi:probable phosphoglycerate mutase
LTRLFLIRHGESVAQVEGFVSGHDTCRGLSDLGRQQAEALRDRLLRTKEIEPDIVLTSILPRAIETAQIIAPAIGGADAQQDCDLCEIHPGEAEGLTWEEFGERFGRGDGWDPNTAAAPGGESWYGFGERVARTLRRYAEDHAEKTIVCVVHGGIVEHAVSAFLGLDAAQNRMSHLLNTSITELRFEVNQFRAGPPRWVLTRFNDAAHVVDLERSST